MKKKIQYHALEECILHTLRGTVVPDDYTMSDIVEDIVNLCRDNIKPAIDPAYVEQLKLLSDAGEIGANRRR